MYAMIVAHEWGVRPSEVLSEWSEAEVVNAFAYIKWKNTPRGN
jgi:hypothetical protein